MEDFGVLIYLAGLVAFYIYRAFRKANKPKQEKPKLSPQQTQLQTEKSEEYAYEPDSEPAKEVKLEDFFKEMFQVEEPFEPVKEIPQPFIEIPTTVEEIDYNKKDLPSFERRAIESPVLLERTVKKKKNITKFNLKQAVIFKTILDRPYK